MENPWKNIPHEDYEGHMADARVGQWQVLSTITKQALEKYSPEKFVLLGGCTGNGLEHVNPSVTREVFCVDINPDYLAVARSRFEKALPGLHLLVADLDRDILPINAADLVMGALILEYVDASKLLHNITGMLRPGGVAVLVIQQSGPTGFVSKTPWKSLERLQGFYHEMGAAQLQQMARQNGLRQIATGEVLLEGGKKFVVTDLQKPFGV
jgi:ubiquinone/menaquinone biosynthesis C-methylase UbiE